MPHLITIGNKLFRVNAIENRVDISYNGGILWVGRSKMGSRFGKLKDLLFYHERLYALTEKGIWFSQNEASDWGLGGSGEIVKSFVALQDGGKEMWALSDEGCMFRSMNDGADWVKRG